MKIGKERRTVIAPRRVIRKFNQKPKELELPIRKPAEKEVKKEEQVPTGA